MKSKFNLVNATAIAYMVALVISSIRGTVRVIVVTANIELMPYYAAAVLSCIVVIASAVALVLYVLSGGD